MSVSLRHTAVVHHEEVDLKLVSAGPPDVVVLRPYEVNQLHTAALALPGGWHCILGICPVPRVVAPHVFKGITLETVNGVPRHAVSASSCGGGGQEGEQEP